MATDTPNEHVLILMTAFWANPTHDISFNNNVAQPLGISGGQIEARSMRKSPQLKNTN